MRSELNLTTLKKSKTPLFLNSKKVLRLIGKKEFSSLKEKVDSFPFQIGLEYSEYFQSGFKQKLDPKLLFRDYGRFSALVKKDEFFKMKNAGFAAALSFRDKPQLGKQIWDLRAFVGRAGDKSSLHFDWHICPNLLLNFEGRKAVFLYEPLSSIHLRGFSNFSMNEKKIDNKHTFILDEGEAVFIPPLWWHQVEYIENAASISIRFPPNSFESKIMNSLYPSWKTVQLYAMKRRRELIDIMKSAEKTSAPVKKFKLIEKKLNTALNFTGRDDPYYQTYCVEFIRTRNTGRKSRAY